MSILVTLTQPAGVTGAVSLRMSLTTQLRASTTAADPSARCASSFLEKGAAYRQQLNLRAERDQALDRVKHLDQMGTVRADCCYSNPSPPVQLQMINFGDAEIESPPHVGDDRSYQGTLFLERMNIAKQQIELQRTHPHGHEQSLRRSGRPPLRPRRGLASMVTVQVL
jgi:hypothetical protein